MEQDLQPTAEPSKPPTSKTTLELIRRGLRQEIKALEVQLNCSKDQLAGKRQQLAAIERHLGER